MKVFFVDDHTISYGICRTCFSIANAAFNLQQLAQVFDTSNTEVRSKRGSKSPITPKINFVKLPSQPSSKAKTSKRVLDVVQPASRDQSSSTCSHSDTCFSQLLLRN